MKSAIADEIAFGGYKDGFNFIEVEDFDFIQTCLDFIVSKANDFTKYYVGSFCDNTVGYIPYAF